MALIKCPECGKEIDDVSAICPECGFPLSAPLSKAVAKSAIESASSVIEDSEHQEILVSGSCVGNIQRQKIIAIGLCVLAVVCFICSFMKATDDRYQFYKEHYAECEEGYNESIEAARNSGWLFKGTYNSIADSYQEMMEDDMHEIWKYRIEAIVLAACGVILIAVGYRVYMKEANKNGPDNVS